MISEGLIWYDKTEKGDWTIVSINGANQESFQNENIVGWETNKGIIPPTCFPTFGYFETPKVDFFTKKFGIKNKNDFKYNPGKYIGNLISLNHSVKSKKYASNHYALTINLDKCFKWNLENGFIKGEEKNKDLVVVKNNIYQKNSLKLQKDHDEFKTHYEVLSKIKSSECNKLAPQLSNCNASYLIKIGRHSGGSIGWIGSYYIFGVFEDKDADKYLVPLKIFNNINYALNFLNKL